jgi:hypothetical protein
MIIKKIITTSFFVIFFTMNNAMDTSLICNEHGSNDVMKIACISYDIKKQASLFNVNDYAQDQEIQKLLALQVNLKQEYDQYNKVVNQTNSTEVIEKARELLWVQIEKHKAEEIIKQSPLFGRVKPAQTLLAFLSPQELLAWIDYYRIDKKR